MTHVSPRPISLRAEHPIERGPRSIPSHDGVSITAWRQRKEDGERKGEKNGNRTLRYKTNPEGVRTKEGNKGKEDTKVRETNTQKTKLFYPINSITAWNIHVRRQ
jgi:hypothetical protein